MPFRKDGHVYRSSSTPAGDLFSSQVSSIRFRGSFSYKTYCICVKHPYNKDSFGFVNSEGDWVETRNLEKEVNTLDGQILHIHTNGKKTIEEKINGNSITISQQDFLTKQRNAKGIEKFCYTEITPSDYGTVRVKIAKNE
ncbi:hypothetical protein HYT51_01815 [Candidatus Woesearchaeota archaeon]|nr:hypothetical protein [Candidatus Woesearchaeota archaeon]